MQAKRRLSPSRIAIEAGAADTPSRYWGIALIGACTVSWLAIFTAAQLILVLI